MGTGVPPPALRRLLRLEPRGSVSLEATYQPTTWAPTSRWMRPTSTLCCRILVNSPTWRPAEHDSGQKSSEFTASRHPPPSAAPPDSTR